MPVQLSFMGADLSTLGFTKKELAAALSRVEAGLTDEDEVPEIAEVAVSQPGGLDTQSLSARANSSADKGLSPIR